MENIYKKSILNKWWDLIGKPYSYLLPALLVFIFISLFPIIVSFILSFFNFSGWDYNYFKEFVGFQNFEALFKDRYFWISFRNTFYFIVSSVTIQLSISLLLAIVIFLGNFKYSVLIRTIIFFPAILAPVAVSLSWHKILEQDGVLNSILHIDFSWLTSVNFAIWIVIFVSIWQWAGYNMVIFYAGLQSIDKYLLDAADVDGASIWGKITKIIIPTLTPVIILNVILNLVGSFRVFDIVYVLTRGGPVHNSEVFTTIMFYYSFAASGPNKMGVGAAVALIMFIIMIFFGIARVRITRIREI